jgi:hypothetical protein
MDSGSRAGSSLYRKIAFALGAIGTVAFVASLSLYWVSLGDLGLSRDSDDWGSFGDFVSGSAGSLIGLATLVALVITLDLQARELSATRSAIDRQQFDATLFRLLERFTDVLRSVEVRGDRSDGEPATGAAAIRRIYTEMRDSYPSAGEGAASRMLMDMHRTIYKQHEAWLGPYFRTLFHVFKLIDRNQNLSSREKVDYSNLVRAQLSRYELALLFYNCITPYGLEFKPLIERYGILKHLNAEDLADTRHKSDATLYRATAFLGQEEREKFAG